MTIPQGGSILKYGQVIRRASRPLKAGEYVHVYNIESARLTRDLARAMTT
jgi:altronate dehydratase small subunit